MELKEVFPVISQAIRDDDVEKVMAMVGKDQEILNMMTPFGTWLHIAADRGKLDIVKNLVDVGLDVNTQGGISNGSALNEAASEGHTEIVKYLISCGAELDVSDSVKNPLFGAILNGHLEVVQILVESGIDYTVEYPEKSYKKPNALGFARSRSQTEIVKYLESIMGTSEENETGNIQYDDISNMSMADLNKEVKKAVTQHYKALCVGNPGEVFYGYSLLTSDDVPDIYPVANSISAITADKDDPMDPVYRYCPDEWKYWDDFGMFARVNQLISKLYEEKKDYFKEYKKDVLNQILESLCELEAEGLFGVKDDERFLVVWVSDSGNEIKRISAEKLNTTKVFKEFLSML